MCSVVETEYINASKNKPKTVIVRDYAYPLCSFLWHHHPACALFPRSSTSTSLADVECVDYRWVQPDVIHFLAKFSIDCLPVRWIRSLRRYPHPCVARTSRGIAKTQRMVTVYPWKLFRWTMIPKNEGRKELMLKRASYFRQRNAARAMTNSKKGP